MFERKKPELQWSNSEFQCLEELDQNSDAYRNRDRIPILSARVR